MGVRKKCRSYLPSPTKWVIQFGNFVLRWVCRRTILMFLCWEMLVCNLTIWWLWQFKKAADLGWLVHEWKAYVVFCGVRLIIAMGGFLAVWKRKPRWTKYFFGSIWLSFLFGCWVVVPIAELSCECTDFQQCRSLQAFSNLEGRPRMTTYVANLDSDLLNPFHPPDEQRYQRALKYEDPPMNPAIASPAPDERGKPKKLVPSTLQLHAQTEPQRRMNDGLFSHIQLRPWLNRRNAVGSNLEVAGLEDTEFVEVDGSGHGHHRHAAVNKGPTKGHHQVTMATDASDDFQGFEGQHKVLNAIQDSRPPLHLYNATDSSLYWVTDDSFAKSMCRIVPHVTETERVRIAGRLHDARQLMVSGSVPTVVVDGLLYSKLWLCVADPLCGAVAAELIRTEESGTIMYTYRVCELDIQLVPKPTSRTRKVQPLETREIAELAHYVNEEGLDTFSAFFEKNPVAVKKDLEIGKGHSSAASSYYTQATKSMTSAEGMQLVSRIQKEECSCEREDSCNMYRDSNGLPKFWCWVASESRRACVLNDIEVFWDAKAHKLWTDGICTGICECSNVGMMPSDENTDVVASKLSKNQLNFGSVCDKWNHADTLPWCYVGFDSTCPDRKRTDLLRANKIGNSTVSNVPMQFYSRLPCDKMEQAKRMEAAQDKCENWSVPAEWGCILHLLLFPVMASVVFQFMANQCGDEWKREVQFAAVFDSDDDDDSADDDAENNAAEDNNNEPADTAQNQVPGAAETAREP